MRPRVRCWATLAAGLLAAACGVAEAPLRLRHETGRALSWRISETDEAPHPLLGVGGTIESEARVSLSCLGADPDGSGQYEVTLAGARLVAPPESGLGVDTSATGPVPGDRVGAAAVVQALLPRHAVVRVSPRATTTGVRPDEEVQIHFRRWGEGKPVASQGAIVRLAGLIDPGPLVARCLLPVSLLLPDDADVRAGTGWTVEGPPLETPAGPVRAHLDVTFELPALRTAVLRARGMFVAAGEAPAGRALDFRSGSFEAKVVIDLGEGVLRSWEEKGRLDFVLATEGKAPTHWTWTRRLEATSDAPPRSAK